MIPKGVVSLLLGDSAPQQKQIGYTYADLLKTLVGVQSYNSFNSPRLDVYGNLLDKNNNSSVSGFSPKIKETSSTRISSTEAPLSGTFPIGALNFNQISVWSALNTYLNNPINEMYTCLRIDPNDADGHVVPTLVVRQNPLSTPKFVQDNIGTNYLELPRWYIHSDLILRQNRGRSNAIRYNYAYLSPSVLPGFNANINPQLIVNYSKPISDSADIKRSGLRGMISTLSSTFDNTGSNAQADQQGTYWNRLMADILFGSHLKFTGTFVLKGIQEPICEGDNCVIDNVIYHIERVMHRWIHR